MKTSNKILLAGLIPVFLFAAVNISMNRSITKKVKPEVEQFSKSLKMGGVRVVDIRTDGDRPDIKVVTPDDYNMYGYYGSRGTIESRAVPSAEWFRRSGDTLIVDRPQIALTIDLPNIKSIVRNGVTVYTKPKDKEKNKPEEPADSLAEPADSTSVETVAPNVESH